MSNYVKIKKGSLKIEMDRDQLINIDETPDGVSFNLKPNIQLMFNDIRMPNDVKIKVRTADVTFENTNLIFDMDDYKKPVLVEAS